MKQDENDQQSEAFAVIKINGKKVKAKTDTGSEVDFIPRRVFDQIDDKLKTEETTTTLSGYGVTNIPVEGVVKMECNFETKNMILIST